MCTRYPIINRVSELKVHIELTRFVQPEKIEIDANERAVNEKSQYCFFVCTTFDSFLNDLLNSTHLIYLISADSHIHFMSYFCNMKGQTRQARWLLTNLTFYNQISGFFLLLQYVSNQYLIYLVFILNPFLKMNSISSFDFTTTF